MATTTNPINTSATSGYVEFYIQTRDLFATNNNRWAFDVSSDGGATWNTRLSEDWNSNTVNLASCVLNSTGANAGSTTVTCTSTAGLTVGRSLYGPVVYSTGTCGTTTGSNVVTCANTTGLQVNMFVTGTGIPNGSRIGAITANTSFTLVNGNSPGTAVNATATGSTTVAATYLSPTATVSSVNVNGTQFTISAAAYFNTNSSPIAISATTINHGYATKADGTSQPYHYNLLASERNANMKMRWQFVGYTATQPTRAPRVDVDDIVVNTTTGTPPVTVTMYDDGLHGDGLAGDGIYGAAIPVQTAGSMVTYSVKVTDSNGSVTTSSTSGTYTVSGVTPPSIFTAAASRSGSDVIVTWPSQAGISYSVQWSDDLIHWMNLPVGQTNTWTDTTAGSVLQRFYRTMR
jgi:hypothetical protein